MSRRLERTAGYASAAAGVGITIAIGLAHWLRWQAFRKPAA